MNLDTNTGKDPNPYYGRVVYTVGLNTDQPLSIFRLGYADRPNSGTYSQWPAFTIFPFWNRQGTAKLGAFSDGKAVKQLTAGGSACAVDASAQRCVKLYWQDGYSPYDLARGWSPQAYFGSLLERKRNAGGTYYRRNRTYDPASGRFTQEDPIGMAGGLNLYGFGNGDPVNCVFR